MSTVTLYLELDGAPASPAWVGAVRRVELREGLDRPSVAALQLGLVNTAGGEVLPLDDEALRPLAPIAVEVGLDDGHRVRLFDGYISHVRPHFETIEANGYVELMAVDASLLMDAHQRVSTFADQTDKEAMEATFARYGVQVQAEDTTARHAADGRPLMQRSTDWAFVQMLARRNGLSCYLEPGAAGVVAHVAPPAVDDTPQGTLRIQAGEDDTLLWLDLQLAAAGPTQSHAADIDPIAKRLIRLPGEATLADMGSDRVETLVEAGYQALSLDPPSAPAALSASLEPAITAAAHAAADRPGPAVEARGGLDALKFGQLLRARRPVLIDGVGQRFSGTYFVTTVRTTVTRGAVAQEFTARRNALGLTGAERFAEVA